MIVDCHGHYTTAPQALWDWRKAQVAGKKPDAPKISDGEIQDSIERVTIDSVHGSNHAVPKSDGPGLDGASALDHPGHAAFRR